MTTIKQPIIYREQDIKIPVSTPDQTMTVPGCVAEGTGLAYYLDKAPCDEGSSLFEHVTGLAYRDYYVLVHSASGMQFGWCVFSEAHIRILLEKVVPLMDWTLPVEQLIALPAWQTMSAKIEVAVAEATKTKTRKRAKVRV